MRNITRLAVLYLALLAFAAPRSPAQDHSVDGSDHDDDKAPKNYLTFEVGYVGSARSIKNPGAATESTTDIEFRDRFAGAIEVRPERSAGGGVTWYPRGDAVAVDGAIEETATTTAKLMGEGAVQAIDRRVITYTGHPVCEANFVNAFVKIRPEEKLYDMQFTLMPDMATTMEAVQQAEEHSIVGAPSLGGGRTEELRPSEVVPLDMGPGQMNLGFSNYSIVVDVTGARLNDENGVLTGTTRIPLPKPPGWSGSWHLAIEVTWTMSTSHPPAELIVTSDDYEKWRPNAELNGEPGTAIIFKAVLKAKTGGPAVAKVRRFEWELAETSSEPGICMNFPVNAARDNSPDLKFGPTSNQRVLDGRAQQLITENPESSSDAVQILPFDWGGWSTLKVRAVLVDGRIVVGRFSGSKESSIRLPKRAPDSFVADSWRKSKKANGADNSDDDDSPVGDGNRGDGLTLYEEYRGYYEAKSHITTSPLVKDFFVEMTKAAPALDGVGLFRDITKLAVHPDLEETELPPSRIINGNHDRGPHVVDQHGIVIAVNEKVEGYARAKGGPGTPRLISIVELMGNAAGYQDTTEGAQWLASTVAHELGHCVNLSHHGDDDRGLVTWMVRGNKVYEQDSEITIVDERTFADLTPELVRLATAQGKFLLNQIWVGVPYGQHSGDERCIMRYDCGRACVAISAGSVRYFRYTEMVGTTLCTSGAGSGVNIAGRSPQPRYGPALQGRGNCLHQIVVNDAVIPTVRQQTSTKDHAP